jgi:hypothetical protein
MGTTVLEVAVYRKRPAQRLTFVFFIPHHSTILNFLWLVAGPSIRIFISTPELPLASQSEGMMSMSLRFQEGYVQ